MTRSKSKTTRPGKKTPKQRTRDLDAGEAPAVRGGGDPSTHHEIDAVKQKPTENPTAEL